MIVVYTAVFGKTDQLAEPRCNSNARFVCFTDCPRLRSHRWEIELLPKQEWPGLASRTVKAMSHEVFPDATHTIWQDANFAMILPPEKIIRYLRNNYIATFPHPDHNRIKEEARRIVELGKAPPDMVYRQLFYYQDNGFDCDDEPMQSQSTGGIVVRKHCAEIQQFNRQWNREIHTWTMRDQMSLDWSAHRTGIRVGRLPGNFRSNPLARIKPSKAHNNEDFRRHSNG